MIQGAGASTIRPKREEVETSVPAAVVVAAATTGTMIGEVMTTTMAEMATAEVAGMATTITMTTAGPTTPVMEATGEVATEEGTIRKAGVMVMEEGVMEVIGITVPGAEEVTWCPILLTMDKFIF